MELIVSRFQGRNGLDRPKGVQEARNALMNGNWNDVERFFHQHDEEAFKFKLTASGETALHVAIKGRRHRQGFFFIRKLIEIYPSDLLAEMDNSGNTALHAVAQLGNVKTACLLVNKSRILLSLLNNDQLLPIQVAANRGRKEMTSYLLTISMTDEFNSSLLNGAHGARVLQSLVNARYCDLALKLLESNPKLAWEDICPLELMAEDPSVFPSGTYFGIWESLICTC
ncbi:ACCELERATED CELL DEATH 6-like [Olea europaea subsp. europaea]|uniref:ACCELERATED CELL DEATH 6-like n=1 Tax=Olea europaea subsp. europaea TaxID=158383 RepID=A0A8S0UWH3_OLEEU|nr:ACCELERATED CELL DEATH 6-like [Olea europaea subsp. europaea]